MAEGLRLSDYGGAVVNRGFKMLGRDVLRGETLTAEEVKVIPGVNLRALIDRDIIRPFPPATPAVPPDGQRFVVRRPDLKYDVVLGVRLNEEPLSKVEAEALCVESTT